MITDRRTLLGAGAALALPAWMTSAFAHEVSIQGATTLDAALAHARAIGKPLLVLVADAPDAGRIWGEYLGSADEARWLDLALVEVACLPRAALEQRVVLADCEPLWAVVLRTDDDAAKPALVAGALPTVPALHESEHDGSDACARAEALATRVRAAIVPDAESPRRLMLASSAAKSDLFEEPMNWAGFGASIDRGSFVRFADLDRHAAMIRNMPDMSWRLPELAVAARIRLFDRDPLGARWDTTDRYCSTCGMGSTAPVSRYFLRFYAQ